VLNLSYKYVRFEVFIAVTMKNAVSRMLLSVDLVIYDVLVERSASIFRVKIIS
jgi:hypothetical protein